MTYALFRPMIENARPRAALWRLLLGLVTVVVVSFGWMAAALVMATLISGRSFDAVAVDTMSLSAQTPGQTLLLLFMVVGLGVGAWLAALIWHRRGLRSLVGRGARTARHFAIAAAVTGVLSGGFALAALPFSDPLTANLAPSVWLVWLPIALVAVAFQTGAEELLFRGYLQSQLAGRFRHPMIWLVLPAILFGLVHYQPTLPVSAAWLYVAFAALFGLIAGDLTARTGSLGAAWGLHFANNSLALLLVGTDGSLTGLALYQSGHVADALTLSPVLVVDLLAVLAVWWLIRRLVAR